MARKQKVRIVEGHLHACHIGRPPVVCGARPVRCAHPFCPDLVRANIGVPHVGGRGLGDDLRSVRRAPERGAHTARGRILGALLERRGKARALTTPSTYLSWILSWTAQMRCLTILRLGSDRESTSVFSLDYPSSHRSHFFLNPSECLLGYMTILSSSIDIRFPTPPPEYRSHVAHGTPLEGTRR